MHDLPEHYYMEVIDNLLRSIIKTELIDDLARDTGMSVGRLSDIKYYPTFTDQELKLIAAYFELDSMLLVRMRDAWLSYREHYVSRPDRCMFVVVGGTFQFVAQSDDTLATKLFGAYVRYTCGSIVASSNLYGERILVIVPRHNYGTLVGTIDGQHPAAFKWPSNSYYCLRNGQTTIYSSELSEGTKLCIYPNRSRGIGIPINNFHKEVWLSLTMPALTNSPYEPQLYVPESPMKFTE